MKRLYGIVLLCLSASAPASAKDSLKDYAQKTQGRQAYGIYFQNVKIGWMISETKLVRRDGKDVVLSSEEGVSEIHREGEKSKIESTSHTYFRLDGKGEIVSIEERKKSDGRETVYKAVPRGGKFVITTEVNGRKDERTVPLPKENFLSAQQLDNWLQSNPKKDSTFEMWSSSLDEREVDAKEVYTFLSKKRVLWGGVATDVYRVKVLSRGLRQVVDMKSDGTVLRGTIGGAMELRAEPVAVAKKLDTKNVDLMRLTSIPADKNLGRASRVESLTLEVLGLDDYDMPTSHRQKLRSVEGAILLDLRRDFRVDKGVPLTKEMRRKFLMATHTIQSDKDKVKKLAAKIVGDEKDPLKVAAKLKTWVYKNLHKTMKANASTTLEVLDNLAGDCTEHTLLFVSLARAAGLPAREVGGVAFANVGKPLFGWHAWAEIHDGSQWVTVDPTWNQLYVDATHVKFSEDGEDMAWLNVLGKVKFKVVKFEKK